MSSSFCVLVVASVPATTSQDPNFISLAVLMVALLEPCPAFCHIVVVVVSLELIPGPSHKMAISWHSGGFYKTKLTLQATEFYNGDFSGGKSWSQSLADLVVASIKLSLHSKLLNSIMVASLEINPGPSH